MVSLLITYNITSWVSFTILLPFYIFQPVSYLSFLILLCVCIHSNHSILILFHISKYNIDFFKSSEGHFYMRVQLSSRHKLPSVAVLQKQTFTHARGLHFFQMALSLLKSEPEHLFYLFTKYYLLPISLWGLSGQLTIIKPKGKKD